MKKIICILSAVAIFISSVVPVFAHGNNQPFSATADIYAAAELDISAKSACLIEASTGKILYASDEHSAASPASITKVMSLLLVCEAIRDGACSLSDTVTVSPFAASMGGSQVFLEEGERFTVEELIKCAVIASANDAIVALAEFISGSEKAFASKMNEKARELGLKNTAFENSTGLDDTTTNHYSSAYDIAVMSSELIKYDIILKYSSTWQDSIRNGEFTLTNTNRLVRYYDGCNGLKTGSTDKAGYCLSATAKRGHMQLVAVVMGAESREQRNVDARALLDYGFSNFALFSEEERYLENIDILRATVDTLPAYAKKFSVVVPKGKVDAIEITYDIPESVVAPINRGTVIGKITYELDDVCIGESDIYFEDSVSEVQIWDLIIRLLLRMLCGR